jgi:Gpi18-like mannosyltransferase
MRNRNTLAFASFALAFAFKAQAIFFLPLLVVLYFRRRISIGLFALVPLTYVALALPAISGGLSWSTALGVYFNQANFYKKLSMNAATLYAWVPDQYYTTFLWFGLIWAAAAGVAIIALCLASPRQFQAVDWLRLSLASVLVLPYLTPGMHDRYYYPADILSLVYAFYVPRRWYLPVLVTLTSLLSYLPYLFDTEVVPVKQLALIMLAPIGVVLYDLVKSFVPTSSSVRWALISRAPGGPRGARAGPDRAGWPSC